MVNIFDDDSLKALRREKRAMRIKLMVFPLVMFISAGAMAWLIYWVNLTAGSSGPPDTDLDTVALGFIRWAGSTSSNFRDDYQPGALLVALAALSIALFLALSAVPAPLEENDTTTNRAARMALDDFSMVVAGLSALLAWLSLLSIDLRLLASLPDAIIAAGTGILCSAIMPLHRVRADVYRLTLFEARQQLVVFEAALRIVKGRQTSLSKFSEHRPKASYSLWCAGAGILAVVFAVVCIRTGSLVHLEWNTALYLLLWIIAAMWAFVTNEMCLATGEFFRKRQYVSAFFYAFFYLFFAVVMFLITCFILTSMLDFAVASLVTFCGLAVPVCLLAYDPRPSGPRLLAGVKIRRIESVIERFKGTISNSERLLAEASA
ncbi:hypothetical protein AAE021_07430 [Arthrobacter citreus]|uniref:ABC transporter permease n=1 Tax=Arthrobacter citreus TaxID=1670 RepID=A0ABZ2ZYX0_9MICC